MSRPWAIGSSPLQVRVVESKGEHTGWRATQGDWRLDLRTFEIRAYPIEPVEGLRPDMSVHTDWRAHNA